ncbi:MAG TPA: CoB--CoM heterodisulfide reductase iron-sulfur subunit B family protein [Sedimentisphaerales bacterium]|nr:CoB--CoM heterodisulfide reductase iron-sulfur subunit B family protein [Sedimentisphaerales bacterium]
MKLAYYPGCSLHSTAAEYDISTRMVCEKLGIDLVEVKDWICCGSSPAHQRDDLMSVALPAKNLALIREMGRLKEVCAPCASCYSRLKVAQKRLEEDVLRKDVETVIGSKCPDDIEVLHVLDVITDKFGVEAVAEKVTRNLNGLKVACYYGCLMTRPPKVTGKGQFENPTQMESLIEALGGVGVDWNMKTFCCGAAFALTKTDVVLELTKKILADAASVGADVISVGCPLCHANLDGRQTQINSKFNTKFHIPIFYFTELMGLALGIEAKDLGLHKHITEVADFLKERVLT